MPKASAALGQDLMRRALYCVIGAWLLAATPALAWKPEATKILQNAADKLKDEYARIQTQAQASVEAELGAQEGCREYALAIERRRAEYILAARLSQEIYRRGKDKPQTGEITRNGKKVTVYFDPASEGYAEVHHEAIEHAKLIVFRGTRIHSAKDILVNLQQFIHLVPERYFWAEELAARIAAENPSSRLLLAGHSLGGGLAMYAAMKQGQEGVAFNPAGFSAGAVRRLSLSPADWRAGSRKIVAFITRSGKMIDPVSALSLAGKTTLAGRRYLIDEENGLTITQLHGMKRLARHLSDTKEAIAGCATDLGFQKTEDIPPLSGGCQVSKNTLTAASAAVFKTLAPRHVQWGSQKPRLPMNQRQSLAGSCRGQSE
ncbi:MAG: hypothetical protein LBU11_01570 [Zoogloeaceae bacterium]|nr:hypothetical protein [Zoogloeaceae bacterium]